MNGQRRRSRGGGVGGNSRGTWPSCVAALACVRRRGSVMSMPFFVCVCVRLSELSGQQQAGLVKTKDRKLCNNFEKHGSFNGPQSI